MFPRNTLIGFRYVTFKKINVALNFFNVALKIFNVALKIFNLH